MFISRKLQSVLRQQKRKGLCWILAFCWISGLFCGMTVYCLETETFASLMRSCIYEAVSISGLLYVNVFPFLLSVFAVFLAAPAMLVPVCFGKAFLTGLVSLGIMDLFDSAGWLCRGLFLFSNCAVLPVLYLYWIRSVQDRTPRPSGTGRAFLAAVAVLGICSLDFCIISPFWASLIDL